MARRIDSARLTSFTPTAGRTARRPRLRLVHGAGPAPAATTPATLGQPIESPIDPRWVLAVRTSEMMQGPLLPPEKRARLVRLGKTMGLSPFDANLIIAIVQDQARRGYAPEYCPTAGEPQLRMVPLTHRRPNAHKALVIALGVLAVLVTEILLVHLFWG